MYLCVMNCKVIIFVIYVLNMPQLNAGWSLIIRDYHIGILVIARIIKPESVSSRADNGRGLILRAMTKVLCYNLFITYSKTFSE